MILSEEEKELIERFRDSEAAFFIMLFDGEGIALEQDEDEEINLAYVLDHLKIRHVNRSYLDMYQYTSPEEVIGKTPRDIFGSPETAKNILGDFYRKQKNTGIFFTYNRHGKGLWLAGSYRVLVRNGRIAGHYGIEKDVTPEMERRLAYESN